MTATSMVSSSSAAEGHSTQNFGQGTAKHETSVRDVGTFLRRLYRTKTPDLVAADTGFAASTIRKLLDRSTKPNFDMTISMIGAYGPKFLGHVWPGPLPLWLSEAIENEERRTLLRQREAIDARLTSS